MARTKDRAKAIKLRKKGMSYSQIKTELGISKSTLSGWLKNMPLSESRIRELQKNEAVIEKIRAAKLKKKKDRRREVYLQVSKDIETSTDKEFVAGFYLYWGEGTKTAEYSVSLTNSDPSMVRCFVLWMVRLGVSRNLLKIKLHLYSDQSEGELKKFWSKTSGVPHKNFYKTYRKKTRSDRKTYRGMFPYGTCVVVYHNRDIYEYVLEGVQYLKDKHGFDDGG